MPNLYHLLRGISVRASLWGDLLEDSHAWESVGTPAFPPELNVGQSFQ